MRGAGPVTIGRDVVYAYITVDGHAARLRVSADECDRLDLFAGRQVRVGLNGREPAGTLVTAVVRGAGHPFFSTGVGSNLPPRTVRLSHPSQPSRSAA